jgi:hypothetical protein
MISALEFCKLPRNEKEQEFKRVKIVTKHTFPSKRLEQDIEDNIGNLSTPMLNKYYSIMLPKL